MKHFNMNDSTKHFWETAYRQNIAKMIGICYRYTQDRQVAEDLAHDAFLVAIDKSSSFENRGPFEAWLRRIVVNVALQYLRVQKKQKNVEEYATYSYLFYDSPEENRSQEPTAFSEAELLTAISLLPEHHRLVFNLYVIDNFTHAQIGNQLGISEGTSKSHLARARRKIRELLNTNLKENKQRKGAAWLWILPHTLWNVDPFFTNGLTDLAIPPQKAMSFDKIDFSSASIPTSKPSVIPSNIYANLGISAAAVAVSLVLVSVLDFNSYPESKDQATAEESNSLPMSVSESDSTPKKAEPFSFSEAKTATLSKNGIIPNETIKQSENMKMASTLGAVLLTGSALTFDSASLLKIAPVGIRNNDIASNTSLAVPQLPKASEPFASTPKKKSPKLSGTFYASSLFWSSVNNELFLKGRVKVNLNRNKFGGIGTFSFINKIDHLVVDGIPMQLNETLKLADKKYYLNELSEEEALRKYGDKAKVVVEITSAE